MPQTTQTMQSFDAAFYRRFYLRKASRVTDRAETERCAAMVAATVSHLELPVRRILDMGCGLGWFKRPLLKAFPMASYTGVEYSEYLCSQFGWTQGSVAEYRGRGLFDLVICCDVLQYVTEREAAPAMANLGRLCRGALYFHAPTREDWDSVIDPAATDRKALFRSSAWYQQRLRRHFLHVGQGVHVRRGVSVVQWELQAPWR